MPLHPFEPGSLSCGLCLRLGRQRDDVRSSRTADKNFLKNFKKSIDKPHEMCYNKYVRLREASVREQPPFEDKHTKAPIGKISVQSFS